MRARVLHVDSLRVANPNHNNLNSIHAGMSPTASMQRRVIDNPGQGAQVLYALYILSTASGSAVIGRRRPLRSRGHHC